MDFSHSESDEAFRAELVDWLDENLPKFLAEWSEEPAARTTRGPPGPAAAG